MNIREINRILAETAYSRTGGSEEELRCARCLQQLSAERGLEARLEPFEVPMYTVLKATLVAGGGEIPCKGYYNSGSGTVEAPLCYMPHIDAVSLQGCRGKIVLVDGPLGAKSYRKLVENGAVGFISYVGDVYGSNPGIEHKELRELTAEEPRIPGVVIHVSDAVRLVEQGVETAMLELEQEASVGCSHNVVAELPGETGEWVLFSAHYDSTALAQGAYDNMSGCMVLLHMADHFAKIPHRYGIRLLWCGSEERGLLGSKAYCARHREELEKVLLNINLDMLGCTMGRFTAFSTADEKTKHYMECVAAEEGFSLEAKLAIRSSDSNSFADHGVPAVSFARYAPGNVASIHTRHDTAAVMNAGRLLADMDFIAAFTERLVTARQFPLDRVICDKIKEDLDGYFHRK